MSAFAVFLLCLSWAKPIFSAAGLGASIALNASQTTSVDASPTQKITMASTVNPNCLNPPRDQCSFYTSCVESTFHCGPEGYPVGYGQKFCDKFSDDLSNFTPDGQKWVLDTMHCLQLALVPKITSSSSTSCDQLEDFAFESHSRCYIENGICKLGLHDWAEVARVVGLNTLFSTWDASKEVFDVIGECVKAWF